MREWTKRSSNLILTFYYTTYDNYVNFVIHMSCSNYCLIINGKRKGYSYIIYDIVAVVWSKKHTLWSRNMHLWIYNDLKIYWFYITSPFWSRRMTQGKKGSCNGKNIIIICNKYNCCPRERFVRRPKTSKSNFNNYLFQFTVRPCLI